jgi:hypothetical protein
MYVTLRKCLSYLMFLSEKLFSYILYTQCFTLCFIAVGASSSVGIYPHPFFVTNSFHR